MTVPTWWQDAIAYQIYPRSFADGNGDGIGDVPGITAKLDYLQWLGVTAIWISPFFPSPLADCGYDVSDYENIAPEYGTLADADRMIAEAHQRGIRVLLDLVMNHTSDQHAWFQASKSSRDNPYRDWYVWHDPVDGGPPNDWESVFGGPAWELDEATGQYYYHMFFKEQPDLNWHNPAVREAMFGAVRFWLDRGVDGYRLDALGTLFEAEGLPDEGSEWRIADLLIDNVMGRHHPDTEAKVHHKIRYQHDLPETFDVVAELRRLCDTYPDVVLLGETDDVRYYGNGRDMLHSVFNFEVTDIETLDAERVRAAMAQRLPTLPAAAWESNTIGNHDRSRAMSLYGDGQDDQARMTVALAMVLFLRGTPVFYNGEEIGMRDVPMTAPEQFRDFQGVHAYNALIARGWSPADALDRANGRSRDKCRTPLLWADAPNGGFCPAEVSPWLPVGDQYAAGVNVADQQADDNSLLHRVRQLGQVRQAHVALRRGTMDILPDGGEVLALWRRHADETCFVALNMSANAAEIALPDDVTLTTVFSTATRDSASETGPIALAPYEVFVAVKA